MGVLAVVEVVAPEPVVLVMPRATASTVRVIVVALVHSQMRKRVMTLIQKGPDHCPGKPGDAAP